MRDQKSTDPALADNDREEWYRSVLDNSRDMIYRLNVQTGAYEYMSPSVETITGYTVEEFMQLDSDARLAITHPDDLARWHAAMDRLNETGQAEVEYRQLNKSGEYRWFSNNMSITRDDSGRPLYRNGNVRDITGRKLANRRLDLQNSILRAINRILQEALTCQTEQELGLVCLNVAVEITQSEFGFIGELDHESGKLDKIAISNPAWGACSMMGRPDAKRLPIDLPAAGILRRALSDSTGVYINDLSSHPDGSGIPEGHPKLTAFLGVPLVNAGTTIGILALGNREGGYDEENLRAVEALAPAIVQSLLRKRAEISLNTSLELYRAMFTDSSVGKAQADPATARFTQVNAAFCRMTGYSEEELLGRTFLDLTHPEDRERDRANYAALLKGETSGYESEKRYLLRGGRVIWVNTSVNLVYDPSGRPWRSMAVVQDITERKQAEEELRRSETRYRMLHESIRDPFVQVAMDGRLLEFNEHYCEMLGYTPGELRALNYMELTPERWHAYEHEVVQKQIIPRGYSDVYEKEYWRKDGTTIPVELRTILSRDENGQPSSMWAIVRDITARKQAQEALRHAKEDLEQRVLERTKALTETVETLNRRKHELQFLASELTMAEQKERQRLAQVLHDGLQQVLVASSMRLSKLCRAKDPDVRRRCSEVLDLISESVEISRSLTAELSPPILHEGGLVSALEWLVRWMHDKQGLAIDLHSDVESEKIPHDITILLFQATRELLFNIVKHAGVRHANVRASQQDGMLVIQVIDHGIGFEPGVLQKREGKTGGFGLFSIRERLGFLGGRMEIDSASGHGSRFTLYAPLAAASTRRAKPPLEETARTSVSFVKSREEAVCATRHIRVMLVDDHLVMRQGLASLIREESDMEVIGEASDGEAAIKLAAEINPDVILMDISMPRMNGIEATRIIHGELPDIRIIGLSMFEEADRAETMRTAGAVNYLAKTGPSENLISAIRDSMKLTRTGD